MWQLDNSTIGEATTTQMNVIQNVAERNEWIYPLISAGPYETPYHSRYAAHVKLQCTSCMIGRHYYINQMNVIPQACLSGRQGSILNLPITL